MKLLRKTGWLCCTAALLALPSRADADTFYVATSGSDSTGDGSSGSPWATIGHALQSGIDAAGGHTILVGDGLYEGTVYLSRGFAQEVIVQAENPYGAKLTDVNGSAEAIRIYHEGPVHITFDGFLISNLHPSYTCPNGRESNFLIHVQDAEDVTFRNNIIFGNNAPGRCNELLKVNRGSTTAYPRNILVQGNVFYEIANAGGSDLIDSVRPGEITIVENIFFSDPAKTESQSFITLKRQVPDPPVTPSSPRFIVARNVFLNWGGATDQAFVQFGEDGQAEYMITDALVENNLIIGNSPAQQAAPFQFKGSQQIMVRANTVVGDLPNGQYGFRIGTEESNPHCAGFAIHNNIWSDPTGTMGTRLINTYGDVDNGSFVLDNNLYWNGGSALPTDGDVTIQTDANRIEGDPLLETDQSNVVLPRWDEGAGAFLSGTTTIRDEFLRLVNTYGALADGSPAVDAADATNMPSTDIRGLARDGQPDVGAFELNAGGAAGSGGAGAGWGGTAGTGGDGAGAGVGGTGTGTGPGADPGASEDDGGCGCRVAGRPAGDRAAGALWLVLAVGMLGRRRGRGRQHAAW